MIGELLRKIDVKSIVTSGDPSHDFESFIQSAWAGENEQLPSFGINGIFDYYGKFIDGEERARYRIPMGRVERSFFVKRQIDGSFSVINEGLFPFDGK